MANTRSQKLKSLPKNDHTCGVCSKNFRKKEHLLSHSLSHKVIKSLFRNACKKELNPNHQNRRSRLHSARNSDVRIPCEKSSTNKSLHSTPKNVKPFQSAASINDKSVRRLTCNTRPHNEENKFSCEVCDKNFRMQSHLESHSLVHSNVHKEDISTGHLKSCVNKNSLLKDNLTPKNVKPFQSAARNNDKSVRRLTCNTRPYNEENKFSCKLCRKNFRMQSHLERHSLVHSNVHKKDISVGHLKCGANKNSLLKDNLTSKNVKPFQSAVSNNDKSVRRLTCNTRPQNEENKFSCKLCHKNFRMQSHLEIHSVVHSNEHKKDISAVHLKCCANKSLLKDNLTPKNVKPFQSAVSNNDKSVGRLTCNTRPHNEENKFSCKLCHKNFKMQSHLERHSLVHSNLHKKDISVSHLKCGGNKNSLLKDNFTQKNVKPLQSVVCKNYKSVDRLNCNTRLRTEENKFSCKLCDRNFRSQSHLERHSYSFSCNVCDKKFCRKHDLENHTRLHVNKNNFECQKCHENFVRKSALNKHYQACLVRTPLSDVFYRNHAQNSASKKNESSKTGHALFTCVICHKAFTIQNDLGNHYVIHAAENEFMCILCDKNFACTSDLRKHYVYHIDVKSHMCEICQKVFIEKKDLTQHYLLQHISNRLKNLINGMTFDYFENSEHSYCVHVCSVCNTGFKDDDDLVKHVFLHNAAFSFFCDVCLEDFQSKEELENHYNLYDKNDEVICELCGKSCHDKFELLHHYLSHKKYEPAKSYLKVELTVPMKNGGNNANILSKVNTEKYCGHSKHNEENAAGTFEAKPIPKENRSYKIYIQNQNFKNSNAESNLIDIADEHYLCEACSEMFHNEDSFKKHQLLHKEHEDCTCEECGMEFSSTDDLTEHYLQHTEETFLTCKICTKICLEKQLLIKHYLYHASDNSYLCEICKFGFNGKSELLTHYFLHPIEYPHVCKLCVIGFKDKIKLSEHYLLHKEENHPICDICNDVFMKEDELVEHQQLFHNRAIHIVVEVQWEDLVFEEDSIDEILICPDCEEEFDCEAELEMHHLIHAENDRYFCEVCDHGYGRKDEFLKHYYLHPDEYPHFCKHCILAFKEVDDLSKHNLLHKSQSRKRCKVIFALL